MKIPVQRETGDAKTSLNNAIYLAAVNGPLVGVIHKIIPTGGQFTTLFFWNGKTHEALGVECGNMGEKSQALKAIAQMSVLASSKLEGSFIASLGKDDETKANLEDGKTVCFILRAPSSFTLALESMQCNGTKTMDNAIQALALDDSTVCLEPTEV